MGSFQSRLCLLFSLILTSLSTTNGQENKPAPLKFDEYKLNFTRAEDEAARLIRFARRLKREPRTQAYIIAYTPRVLNFYGSSHWYIAENRCLTTKAELAPKRSSVRRISGRVIAEAGRPAKEAGSVPACIGLFTEEGHRLIATVVADEEGRFRLTYIPPGQYRLVVRDPQDVFCLANMPLRVVRWPGGKTKPLVIHMRPSGIDDCSYGDFN